MIKYKFFTLESVNFYIKNLDLDIEEIKFGIKEIPKIFFSNIKNIVIHDSDVFDAKQTDAFISEDTIEISSKILTSVLEFKKILIHELFHSIELDLESELSDLYNEVREEFLQKKKKILDSLSNDPRFSKPEPSFYNSIEHDYEFDNFLERKIGTKILDFKIIDIFPSPYAISCLSEYVAICLEIFFFENRDWVFTYCPAVFKLLNSIKKR